MINVGSVWEKNGSDWGRDSIGNLVIVYGVSSSEIKYRYLNLEEWSHGSSGGWNPEQFKRAFILYKDVIK
jgi:hypothetical protein